MVTLNELIGCSPVPQKNGRKLKNKFDFNYKKLANGNLLLSKNSETAGISSTFLQREHEYLIFSLQKESEHLIHNLALTSPSLESITGISSTFLQREHEYLIFSFQKESEHLIHNLALTSPPLESITGISSTFLQKEFENAFSSEMETARLASYSSLCSHNVLLSATEKSFAIDTASAIDAYKNIGVDSNYISREFAYSSAVDSLNDYIDDTQARLNLNDAIFDLYGFYSDIRSIKDSFDYLENSQPQKNKKYVKKKETKDIWNKGYCLPAYNKIKAKKEKNKEEEKLEKTKNKIKALQDEISKQKEVNLALSRSINNSEAKKETKVLEPTSDETSHYNGLTSMMKERCDCIKKVIIDGGFEKYGDREKTAIEGKCREVMKFPKDFNKIWNCAKKAGRIKIPLKIA